MTPGLRWMALVSVLVGTASLHASPAFASALDGCRSHTTLAPWGRYPMRRWTPIRPVRQTATIDDDGGDREGLAIGAPFRARLVQAYGVDDGDARQIVEMVTAAGCYRAFRADSFSAADRAFVSVEQARHPYAADPNLYATVPDPAQVQPGDRENGRIGAYETQHFVFWYGTNPQGESYAWVRASGQDWPTFLKRAGDWAEWVWRMSRDLTGAPMPYADSPAGERRRIAIYLYGTGRPHVDGGDLSVHGANASPSVWISAQDMAFGSKTFAHEFGHVIQFYSGGFRGGTTAGPVWESVANWLGHLLVPGKTTWISHYGNHLYLGPVWPVARYGAYPFIDMLFEDARTQPLVWGAWRHDRRLPTGDGAEDFLPAVVRLGQSSGAYPQGMRSFADDMGWYGARLVTLDFLNQRAMLDATGVMRFLFGGTRWASLLPGDRPGRYVPQPGLLLHQFGSDLIPLTVTGADARVSVRLTGGTTDKDAAWRFALVAVRGGTEPTYSPLGAVEGRGSAVITYRVPRDARLFLAVTATPGVYEPIPGGDQVKPTAGARFPYALDITGATPRLKGDVDCAMPQMIVSGQPRDC